MLVNPTRAPKRRLEPGRVKKDSVPPGGAWTLSSGLNIRGSRTDGFQILLDGVPVYSQSHFFGMFDLSAPGWAWNKADRGPFSPPTC